MLATTQMESTDARRAFPCFDEPEFKATFEVTLIVDEGLNAYSNSPVAEEIPEPDGRRQVHFAPTMVMSTYLVAFIVGPLEHTDPVDVGGVPLRVVHPPGKGHLTAFALDVGAHALRFFTDYFGIPYPGDKLDMVAIPDFAAGAMENLGCVTYRESALLVDPATAARVELERVADVVCHEIAHMWFGDLVTMKWWNGIWLNEAFATFMEVLAVDAYEPEWQRWVSFGVEREAAMAVDGLHSTRPVEFPVGRPEEAEGMFDVLTYQKGGSVLRMLEQFIGPDVFREGIHDYLVTHAYSNTETADLWNALERSSGRPVATIMDTWINQGGYPLMTVGEGGAVAQQPFSYSGSPGGAIGSRWQIPIMYRSLGSDDSWAESGLLTAPSGTVDDVGDTELRGQRRRVRLLPGGIRHRHGGPAGDAARRAHPARAVQPGVGHLGRHPGRRCPAGRPAAPGQGRRRLRRGRPERVVRGHRRTRSPGPRHPRRRARHPGRRCAVAPRPPGGPPRDGILPRPTTSGPRRCGPGRSLPSAPSATTPMCGPKRPRGSLRPKTVRSRAIPHRPSSGSWPHTAGSAEYETYLDRYRAPADPQEEHRYLDGLAGFRDAGLADRTFDLAMTEVRSQDAPFLIRLLLWNRETGRGHMAAGGGGLGRVPRQIPLEHVAPDARRRPGPVHATRARRRGDSVRGSPSAARRRAHHRPDPGAAGGQRRIRPA